MKTKKKKATKKAKKKATKSLGLYKKIHLIMSESKKVAKTGHNDFQHYNYATEEDILAEIRPLLIKHGLIILPSVTGERTIEKITSLNIDFKIIDIETKEEITLPWVGYGHDKLDKGGYKALTGAVKYFLAKTFLLASGNDPEESRKKEMAVKTNIAPGTIQETIKIIRGTKDKKTLNEWIAKIEKSDIYSVAQKRIILTAIQDSLKD